MVDLIKKSCVFVVTLSLCVAVFISSVFLLPVSAIEIKTNGELNCFPINKLNYIASAGDEWTTITPISSTEYIIDSVESGNGWSSLFNGRIAYSSRFNLPIQQYKEFELFFNMTPDNDVVRLYQNATTLYLNFTFGLYCSSMNLVYPERVRLTATWTDSLDAPIVVYLTKQQNFTGSSAYALYTGIIEFDANQLSSNYSDLGWELYIPLDNVQMQGYNVTFQYATNVPIWTASYEEAEAIEQATLDILANGLSPTVNNIQQSAEKIIENQEIMQEVVDKLPEDIVNEQMNALESKEEEEKQEYIDGVNENSSAILDSITEESIPILSVGESVQTLWNSFSTHSRTSELTFPALSVPLGDEVHTFSVEQTIDIDGAINQLPSWFIIVCRSAFMVVMIWGLYTYVWNIILSLVGKKEDVE